MKFWEHLRDLFKERYCNGSIFFTKGKLPHTKEEKYWYNKALEDSVFEVRNFEKCCEQKYESLIDCLSRNGIYVTYDERCNEHRIVINKEVLKLYKDDEPKKD